MAKILKEPLLYFVLLGAAIFALFQQVADESFFPAQGSLEEIVISVGQLDALIVNFERIWQRQPDQRELDGLVEEFVREEVFYREAIAMGLDKDDAIIRRRLRQKLEFLTEDVANLEVPEEEELQHFLDKNSSAYLTSARFSFQQIYFDVSERGASAVADAQALLLELEQGGITDITTLGDQLMMTEVTNENISERDVQRILGNQFLGGLLVLPVGRWQGPVESGFGIHLVYLNERVESAVPVLEEVRSEVLHDWTARQQDELSADFYNTIRQRYRITVENLAAADKAP